MTKSEKEQLRQLVFSNSLENVLIAEEIAKGQSFEMPISWKREIMYFKLANHKSLYPKNVCPCGIYAGVHFRYIPIMDLVEMYNCGVLEEAKVKRYSTWWYWFDMLPAIRYRVTELVSEIKGRFGIKHDYQGFLDGRYYYRLSRMDLVEIDRKKEALAESKIKDEHE